MFNAAGSGRKWYLVQVCFVYDENAVVPGSWRAPVLSSYICTGEIWGNVSSLNESETYTASWLAYGSAMYSDSHDEVMQPPIDCFFELHVCVWFLLQTCVSNLKRGAIVVCIVTVDCIRIPADGEILRTPLAEIRWCSLEGIGAPSSPL